MLNIDIQFLINNSSPAQPDFVLEDILRLKSTLLDVEKAVDELDVPSKGLTKPGMYV